MASAFLFLIHVDCDTPGLVDILHKACFHKAGVRVPTHLHAHVLAARQACAKTHGVRSSPFLLYLFKFWFDYIILPSAANGFLEFARDLLLFWVHCDLGGVCVKRAPLLLSKL